MLDAFIIDRIRQQQNRHRESVVQLPLHIEVPELVPGVGGWAPDGSRDGRVPEKPREEQERGVVIIDFSI